MNELTILATLASIHWVALMSPGPDFALVVQNTTRYGRQTGLYIALGLSCGILLHSILSLTGVSYLVHQHPGLFAMVQLLGGSYLLYLGIGALRGLWLRRYADHSDKNATQQTGDFLLASKRQAFSRGFATNILNPKALVFFISLMSSLVPAGMSLGGKGAALVILWALSFLWFALLAWLLSSSKLQSKLHNAAKYIDAACGFIFSLIGFTILLSSLADITMMLLE
ncbi:LysE family translocator [Vibrio panuliri]|uniref:Threonine transporter n=1 Tax=Vibrio panuliri TaxID=1381081 RepID=A0A1Q9HNP7_9VIBR|nr:LysE family translocator [Vibrio panuliri]KAB1460432.1 LysE family translocator [Vibrio panuliri]OLQ92238.1 threonine transporter [Vibrio panuliri]OLQ92433.1 threonine transporter [Vibrio panuliri]